MQGLGGEEVESMTTEKAAEEAPPRSTPTANRGFGARLREWLLRSEAIAEARACVEPLGEAQRERLSRSRAAAAVGDWLLASGVMSPPMDTVLSPAHANSLALSMYREALFWALWASA